VTVTNTGWNGSFEPYVLIENTDRYVHGNLTVDNPVAGGYKLSVYDELGRRICEPRWYPASQCTFNAALNEVGVAVFYGYVALDAPTDGRPRDSVRAATGPIVVAPYTDAEIVAMLEDGHIPGFLASLVAPGITATSTDSAFCLKLGYVAPRTHRFRSSLTDIQAVCVSVGAAKAMALIVGIAGVAGLYQALKSTSGTSDAHPPLPGDPAPQPEPPTHDRQWPGPGPVPFPQPDGDDDETEIVYRVWGGASGDNGRSWTPLDPREVELRFGEGSYRDLSGLPDFNTGEFLSIAVLLDVSAIDEVRAALPWEALDGYSVQGGLTEYIIRGGCSHPAMVCDAAERLEPPYRILDMHRQGIS
jgi:hypothetical protein